MPEESKFYIVDIAVTGPVTPQLLEQQRAFLSMLTANGQLLLAAVVPEASGRGMAIVRASSIDQVRELYAASPIIAAGAATHEVHLLRLSGGTVLNAEAH